MIFTSRLDRRTAALSMICSGLYVLMLPRRHLQDKRGISGAGLPSHGSILNASDHQQCGDQQVPETLTPLLPCTYTTPHGRRMFRDEHVISEGCRHTSRSSLTTLSILIPLIPPRTADAPNPSLSHQLSSCPKEVGLF